MVHGIRGAERLQACSATSVAGAEGRKPCLSSVANWPCVACLKCEVLLRLILISGLFLRNCLQNARPSVMSQPVADTPSWHVVTRSRYRWRLQLQWPPCFISAPRARSTPKSLLWNESVPTCTRGLLRSYKHEAAGKHSSCLFEESIHFK
jgi:hypothetical protein